MSEVRLDISLINLAEKHRERDNIYMENIDDQSFGDSTIPSS